MNQRIKAIRMFQSKLFKVLERPNRAVSGSGVIMMLKESHLKMRDQKLCSLGQTRRDVQEYICCIVGRGYELP